MKERMLRRYKKAGNTTISFIDFCREELSKDRVIKDLSEDEKEFAITVIMNINGIYGSVSE